MQALAGLGDIVGDHHRGGLGHRQGEAVVASVASDLVEHIDQGVDLALAQQLETVPVDDVEHGIQVACPAELVDRLGVAALG